MQLLAPFFFGVFFEPREQLGSVAMRAESGEGYKVVNVKETPPRKIFTDSIARYSNHSVRYSDKN